MFMSKNDPFLCCDLLFPGVYDSRTRVLVHRITTLLDADWLGIRMYEVGIVARFKEDAHELTE